MKYEVSGVCNYPTVICALLSVGNDIKITEEVLLKVELATLLNW